jgi:hypothetical protein
VARLRIRKDDTHMNIYVIYKTVTDSNGYVSNVEITECDIDEANAQRFCKLYNLQTSKDLSHRIRFDCQAIRVN